MGVTGQVGLLLEPLCRVAGIGNQEEHRRHRHLWADLDHEARQAHESEALIRREVVLALRVQGWFDADAVVQPANAVPFGRRQRLPGEGLELSQRQAARCRRHPRPWLPRLGAERSLREPRGFEPLDS
jgi:hypothetical protein